MTQPTLLSLSAATDPAKLRAPSTGIAVEFVGFTNRSSCACRDAQSVILSTFTQFFIGVDAVWFAILSARQNGIVDCRSMAYILWLVLVVWSSKIVAAVGSGRSYLPA